jgi:aldehyde:ferredoxin oxidoreductase
VIMNQNKAELKDSVTSCEWQSPNLFWPEMEAEAFPPPPVFP